MMKEPYKCIDSYGFDESDIFFGREKEVKRMVKEIISTKLLVFFSPSGSGKTSLINAGVRPALEKRGYKTIYALCDDNPITSVITSVSKELKLSEKIETDNLHTFLTTALSHHLKKDSSEIKPPTPIVIFLDQFEEFFIVLRNYPKQRKEFFWQLSSIKNDDQLQISVVISIRDNYYVKLFEFRHEITLTIKNSSILLGGLSIDDARLVIEEPAKKRGVYYEDKLIDSVVNELKNNDNRIDIVPLQLVCHALWMIKRKNEKEIHFKDYKLAGRAKKILQHRIFTLIETIPKEYHALLSKIFTNLRTKAGRRRFVSRKQLFINLRVNKRNKGETIYLLNKLVNLNILNREKHINSVWYEIKHDYLVNEINEWTIKYQKHKKKRLRSHGTTVSFIIICCAFLAWVLTLFNQFEASFTDQVYENQMQEIVIKRRFNPFNFKVSTGIFQKDLKDTYSLNLIKNRYIISSGNKNNWYKLFEILSIYKSGYLMYKAGHVNEGIKHLIMSLDYEDSFVRMQAVEMLRRIGKTDKDIITYLISHLKDDDKEFYSQFSDTIAQAERIIREAKVSEDVSKSGNNKLVTQEENAVSDTGLINSLLDTLKKEEDKDSHMRRKTINALVKLGKKDENVTAALVSALKDRDPLFRSGVMDVLILLGKNNKDVTDTLANALKDANSGVRTGASDALLEIGQRDMMLITSLITALKDKDSYVRNKAAEVLVKLGQSDLQVINASILALTDIDDSVRLNAALTLGEIGRRNVDLVEVLLTLKEDNADLRIWQNDADVLENLSKSNQETLDALIVALQDEMYMVRAGAADALGKIGKSDQNVIAALVDATKDKRYKVRAFACKALGKLGYVDKKVIKALITSMKDKGYGVRLRALEALEKLGYSNDEIIEALIVAINDTDFSVRNRAENILGKLLQSKTSDDLLIMLSHNLSGYRRAAVEVIKQKQSISSELANSVKKLKDETKSPWVRISAWDAYEIIMERRKSDKMNISEIVHLQE